MVVEIRISRRKSSVLISVTHKKGDTVTHFIFAKSKRDIMKVEQYLVRGTSFSAQELALFNAIYVKSIFTCAEVWKRILVCA